jgi:hypothetical protein
MSIESCVTPSGYHRMGADGDCEGCGISQDALDGAALRRLREAWRPEFGYWDLYIDHTGVPHIAVTKPNDYEPTEWYFGATIAEAADKCREALG